MANTYTSNQSGQYRFKIAIIPKMRLSIAFTPSAYVDYRSLAGQRGEIRLNYLIESGRLVLSSIVCEEERTLLVPNAKCGAQSGSRVGSNTYRGRICTSMTLTFRPLVALRMLVVSGVMVKIVETLGDGRGPASWALVVPSNAGHEESY